MRCPFCGGLDNKVIDSRLSQGDEVIRRRRECEGCDRRFTTYERLELVLPMVVKKDGRREPFERLKVLAGLRRACEKRPVSTEALDQLVDRIERSLVEPGDKKAVDRERRTGDGRPGRARSGRLRRFASCTAAPRHPRVLAELSHLLQQGKPTREAAVRDAQGAITLEGGSRLRAATRSGHLAAARKLRTACGPSTTRAGRHRPVLADDRSSPCARSLASAASSAAVVLDARLRTPITASSRRSMSTADADHAWTAASAAKRKSLGARHRRRRVPESRKASRSAGGHGRARRLRARSVLVEGGSATPGAFCGAASCGASQCSRAQVARGQHAKPLASGPAGSRSTKRFSSRTCAIAKSARICSSPACLNLGFGLLKCCAPAAGPSRPPRLCAVLSR